MTKKILSFILVMIMFLVVCTVPLSEVQAAETFGTTISAGVAYSMVIKADGSLWAWGANGAGQLGDGTRVKKLTPVKIMEEVASVSTARFSSMVIKYDGSLWAWGNNKYVHLGDGTETDRLTPVKIMDGVAKVSTGESHTLAVKKDGSLWAWGLNEDGQLGDGTLEDRLSPVKIMDGVADVSTGLGYSMAIKTDGSLWTWGENDNGQLGDGTTENRLKPVKVMERIVSISAGDMHSAAIDADGSLWAWGSNSFGQIGDTNGNVKDNQLGYPDQKTPLKIMDEVNSVSAGWGHTMAIKADGSLWAWGLNYFGELGNDRQGDESVFAYAEAGNAEGITAINYLIQPTPIKVMDGFEAVSAGSTHTLALKADGTLWAWGSNNSGELGNDKKGNYIQEELGTIQTIPEKITDNVATKNDAINRGYIYDTVDPGDSVVLPVEELTYVWDSESAASAVSSLASGLTASQKKSPTGIDRITLFAEQAIMAATNVHSDQNNFAIFLDSITYFHTKANEAKAAVKNAIAASGITTQREISAGMKTVLDGASEAEIYIETDVADTTLDSICFETIGFTITLSKESLVANLKESHLELSMKESIAATASGAKAYTISFNKPLTDNIKISLPPMEGDPTYQAIVDSNGKAVGGKYNPATGMLEARIKAGGTYTVKNNKKEFIDLAYKSKEMQDAINILASKGIINGTSTNSYSPDATISRVEIAAVIVRTLSKLDQDADGGFDDVNRNDWFFSTAGSAKKYGIMKGTGTSFEPKVSITKDQIVAVAARTLRNAMKYSDSANTGKYLAEYMDNSELPSWGVNEVTLATRENLVIKRADDMFKPKDVMTRGDAAIILYRMFNRIW